MCRTYHGVQRFYYAVVDFLNTRLKLDISPEKSKVVNLKRNLKIYIPDKISKLDKKGTAFPIEKTIVEEQNHNEKITYYLPIDTMLTLDKNGVRIRPAYQIPVEAQKANGTKKSITLYLDVKGNVLDGIKTEIIGTGQDRNK